MMPDSISSIPYTRRLAEFVCGLSYASLPPSVVAQARIVVLDTLTSIVGASTPELAASRIVQELAREAGGAPQATVSGLPVRVPAASAAFANGTMADNLELDDSHPRTGAHIAAAVVPAALAAAEWQHASGQRFVEAIVAAYDVECRAILAANPSSMYARGFHPSAVFGAFGAAVAAARIMGLSVAQTVNALGLAGSEASGLMAWETDPTQMPKSLQLGIAARSGVTAALLASKGFAGPPAIFEGRYNVLHAFSDQAQLEPLLEELGTRWEINLTGLKLYPVCRFLHATLDAFFEIQGRDRPAADEIDEILVRMPASGVKIIDNNELRSHSAQYVLSLAALNGCLEVEDIYRDERGDPRVAALMGKIHVGTSDQINAEALGRFSEPAEVEVRLRGGRRLTARAGAASGDPEKALSWEIMVGKFFGKAMPVIGREAAEAIVSMTAGLGALDDVARLAGLIQGREEK